MHSPVSLWQVQYMWDERIMFDLYLKNKNKKSFKLNRFYNNIFFNCLICSIYHKVFFCDLLYRMSSILTVREGG